MAAILAVACVDRTPTDERHTARVHRILAQGRAEQDRAEARIRTAAREISRLRRLAIEVSEGSDEPKQHVAFWFQGPWQACAIAEQIERAICEQIVGQAYLQALRRRYSFADFRTLIRASANVTLSEAEFARSHNTRLAAHIQWRRRLALDAHATSSNEIAHTTSAALTSSARIRDAELEEAERQVAMVALAAFSAAAGAARAYSAGLQARAQALQQPPGPWRNAVATPDTTPVRATCSSDLDCGIGWLCTKPNYSAVGVCLRSVNEFGVPQYDVPRSESILLKVPSPVDCRTSFECPVGFACNQASGMCLR